LDVWPELEITGDLAKKILGEISEITDEDEKTLSRIVKEGRGALELAAEFAPAKNHEVWTAMTLSARIAVVCAESRSLENMDGEALCRFQMELDCVIVDAEAEWDKTRFHDDPLKSTPHFKEPNSSYLLPLLRELKVKLAV
jgi:hypothetical protein